MKTLLLFTVAIVALVLLPIIRPSGTLEQQCVWRTPYGTIYAGMMQNDVERILGGPPGFYPDQNGYVAAGCIDAVTRHNKHERPESWWFGLDTLIIYFDKGSRTVRRVEWFFR